MRSLRFLPAALCLLLAMPACGGADPDVSGVAWHRFPIDAATRVEPALAVIYSTDNIGPTTTLASLGYPDRLIFRLHQDHPRLKVVLTSCPANRYSGGRTLADSPEATATWKSLALDPNFEWVDLAGLGYSHSPPDDTNLNHHEFSVKQSGCNIDHRTLGKLEYTRGRMGLARDAFRAAGIPDDRVLTMRFPGMEHSPAALEAALGSGFLAVLDSGHDDAPGLEWWTAAGGGEEVLHIHNTNVLRAFSRSKEIEESVAAGRMTPEEVASSPEFAAAVARGMDMVRRAEATGGLLHLMDQWAETFREVGGTRPRYLLLDAVLDEIETRYGPRACYPTSRELVLWLDTLRHASVSRRQESGAVIVAVEPPPEWARRGLPGLNNVSLRIALPPGEEIAGVDLRAADADWEPLAPSAWWKAGEDAVVLFPLRGRVVLKVRLSRA